MGFDGNGAWLHDQAEGDRRGLVRAVTIRARAPGSLTSPLVRRPIARPATSAWTPAARRAHRTQRIAAGLLAVTTVSMVVARYV